MTNFNDEAKRKNIPMESNQDRSMKVHDMTAAKVFESKCSSANYGETHA